jgi:hypothetical protein
MVQLCDVLLPLWRGTPTNTTMVQRQQENLQSQTTVQALLVFLQPLLLQPPSLMQSLMRLQPQPPSLMQPLLLQPPSLMQSLMRLQP